MGSNEPPRDYWVHQWKYTPTVHRDAYPAVWRREVDVNLQGPFLLVREFLRGLPANPSHNPTVVAISSSASVEIVPGLGNYCIAKGALNRLVEFVAAENPHVSAVAMHPGIITTAMSIKEFEPFEGDSMELVGGMAVWLSGDHARWVTGRSIGVNWDVDELVASKEKVLQRDELKAALKGSSGEQVGTVDTKAYKAQPL
ncbi:hypothetical protein BKA80DRAFT_201949 [Phyllosticta citrichinensis]